MMSNGILSFRGVGRRPFIRAVGVAIALLPSLALAQTPLPNPIVLPPNTIVGRGNLGSSGYPYAMSLQELVSTLSTLGIWTAGGDLSGTLPNPTVAKVNGNTPGGSCSTNQFANSISSSAVPSCSQPAVAGLSGYTATTWTPVLSTTGTAGTPAYNFDVGSYEQIGREVTARFSISLSGWTGSPTGNVQITGLPVASSSATSDYGPCFIGNYGVTGLAANTYSISGYVAPGTSIIVLTSNSNTGQAGITAAEAGTTAQFIGACFYHT